MSPPPSKSHEDVDQVQVAHGLHGRETNERRGEQHDAGGCELEGRKEGGASGEPRHHGAIRPAGVASHEPENEDRRDGAQPLVPGPAADEVVVARIERLLPRG